MGIAFSSVVETPVDETFAWHERPGAIERLLPPFQPVRVEQEAERLSDGKAVLRLPAGLRWVAVHEQYDPPHGFADRLVSLPLRWRHCHRFEALGRSSTRVLDDVDTPIPSGLLRPMFVYRHRQLADDLRVQRSMRSFTSRTMTIGVTGASGLIGRALCPLLTTGGHRVIRLVRRSPSGADERCWQPDSPDPAIFEGLDVVVHLAGASIAGRFTPSHKRAVYDSRVGPTAKLAHAVATSHAGPGTLVSASAVGFYGPSRGDEELTEESTPGDGFLADLVCHWEKELGEAASSGVRTASIRTGVVQSPQGGALKLQRPIFVAGLGGRLGSGEQWLSWIDIDDLCDVFYRVIVDDRCRGPINAVSPHPVTSEQYAQTLARVLRRPALIPAPRLGVDVLLGREGAREVALASQRVVPQALADLGHEFRRPQLEQCLRHQLGHPSDEERSPGS